MTTTEFLSDYTVVVINVIFWASLIFPLVIRLIWPWHRSDWGRNIVFLDLTLACTLLASVVKRDWGLPYDSLVFFEWFQTISLSAVPLILAQRTWIIWKTQRSGAIARLAEAIRPVTNGEAIE